MGSLAVQAYIYFSRFPDDRLLIKTLVTSILVLETSMTALTFYTFWTPLTVGSDLSSSAPMAPQLIYTFQALAPITGLEVTTLTHGFYCWRISFIRKSRLLSFPIMMVSLLQLTSVIYLAFIQNFFPSKESFGNTLFSPVTYKLSPWLVTWLGSSVFCDSAITISMILILRPSKSYFNNNKSTLVKLTRLTVETGLVTTIAAILELILGVVYKDNFNHIAVFYVISKLYANCLLASLNFRLVLRDQSEPSLTTIVWDDLALSTQSKQPGSQPIHVQFLESGVDMVNDLNRVDPRRNNAIEDQTCEMYELLPV
ncbi:hypothetical protein OG21DRAFT_387555 [Imleria badia]|nr:hypothetical protein OG21DRAFT_387555 [Imleria badia]